MSRRRCRTTSTASPGSIADLLRRPRHQVLHRRRSTRSAARGPKPFPGAFWWEGPSGKKVLAWNGYHYLFGRSQAGLGNWDLVDRLLPRWIDELESDRSYPFDFLYCESTHPVRVDNGPPDARMPEFVKRWNERGPRRTDGVHHRRPISAGCSTSKYGKAIGTQRGDWTDHWADGVGLQRLRNRRQPRRARDRRHRPKASKPGCRSEGAERLGRRSRRRDLRER